MKIKKIELYNFGSYEGCCTFDLTSNDPEKRIVIIGGKNGAGKTTLFTAIQLCLYGNYAFGYKSAGRFYLKEIYNLINNRARLNPSESAYIKISFQHAESRECSNYEITRFWSWENGSVEESIRVSQNDIEMDTEEIATFQNYLIHLIPPDMLKLYFFDGEKIADYFLSNNQINIREALMILSGNDTFDILHDNVRRVLNLNKKSDEDQTGAYLEIQQQVAQAQENVDALQAFHNELLTEKTKAENELEQLRSQYAAHGGLTLSQWNDLQGELKTEEEKRERINWQRKSIATDILPFLILKNAVSKVLPQIKDEEEYMTYKLVQAKLNTSDFFLSFEQIMHDAGVQSNSAIKEALEQISNSLLSGNWDSFKALFCLSDDEKMQIHAVLNRVKDFDTHTLLRYQKRIDASLKRSKEIRAKIQSSDIEHIEDYTNEIANLESNIQILQAQIGQNEAELEAAKAILDSQTQHLAATRKLLEQQLKKASVSALSGRVLLLLEDLQSNIYTMLTKQVEIDLKYKLNQLMRKNKFFDDIIIDSDFNVHILRNQTLQISDLISIVRNGGQQSLRKSLGESAYNCLLGDNSEVTNSFIIQYLSDLPEHTIDLPIELDKDRMSSGEKQIFVMSLYWSLMQQSKNDLPFIIDTPFARIDTEHRANITKHFFLDLSGQLFILSTNEEINERHLDIMGEQVSRVYMLEYGDDKRTYAYQNQYFEV